MIIKFDSFNRYEIPEVALCNPNNDQISIIDGIQDFEIIPTLNQVSELSCTVNKYSGDIENPCYNIIEKLRQLYVGGFGYFIILDVNEENAGTGEAYKTITAFSCEFELSNVDMPPIPDGNFNFDVLMNTIVQYLPNWTLNVSTIPGTIMSKSRYFEDVDTNIYNFLLTSVEEAFNCLFEFDITNRSITVFDKDNFVTATSVLLTNDDVVNSIKIAQNTKEMYTAVKATGGNDLDIAYVNPLGTNYIYDFHYYKNNKWMSQGLVDALTAWESKIETNKSTYSSLISSLITKYNEKSTIEANLAYAKKSLDDLQTQKSNIIADNGNLTTINTAISTQQGNINSLSSQLALKESEITTLENHKLAINNVLSFNANFTADQYKELTHYILCCKHQTDNITVSDDMPQAEIIQKALELYNDAKSALNKISDPKYEYTVDTESFIFSKVFEPYTSQLATGCLVDIQLAENNIASLILLSMSINFIDGTVSFKFGNRYRLSNQRALWDDLQNRVASTSSTVENLKDRWNYPVKSNAVDEMKDFMNSSLDITKNAIISSDGQSIEVRDDGIHIRRKLSDGTLDTKELIITNGTIAFSNDNFATSKLALGTITFPDSSTAYGLIAEAIYGNLIAGNKLTISNEDGSVVIDGSGVNIYSGGLTIWNKSNGEADNKKMLEFIPDESNPNNSSLNLYGGRIKSLAYPSLSTSLGLSELGTGGAFLVTDTNKGDLFSIYTAGSAQSGLGSIWAAPFANTLSTNRKGIAVYPDYINMFADYNGSPKGINIESSTGNTTISSNNLTVNTVGDVAIGGTNLTLNISDNIILNSDHLATNSSGTMTVKTNSSADTIITNRDTYIGSFLANFMNDGVQSTLSFQRKSVSSILKSLLVLTAYPMWGSSSAILLHSNGYDRACFGDGSNNDEIRFDLVGSGTTYTKNISVAGSATIAGGASITGIVNVKDTTYPTINFNKTNKANAPQAQIYYNGDSTANTLVLHLNRANANSAISLDAATVYANGVAVTSDRNKKTDIVELSDNYLDKVNQMKFYSYDLDMAVTKATDMPTVRMATVTGIDEQDKEIALATKKHIDIGIMADEAPTEILGDNGKSIDLYKYCNVLAKAIQEQNEVIKSLREEINALKNVG